MLLFDVRLKFKAAIQSHLSIEPDKMNYCLRHERLEMVINNMCDQIMRIERKLGRKLNGPKFQKTIEQTAINFCELALKHRDEQNLSTNEVGRRHKEADYWKEIAKEFDESVKHKSVEQTPGGIIINAD